MKITKVVQNATRALRKKKHGDKASPSLSPPFNVESTRSERFQSAAHGVLSRSPTRAWCFVDNSCVNIFQRICPFLKGGVTLLLKSLSTIRRGSIEFSRNGVQICALAVEF